MVVVTTIEAPGLGPEVVDASGRGHQPKAAAPGTPDAPTEALRSRAGVRHDWSAAYIRHIRAQRPKTFNVVQV
jgi:hypothetical protein